MVQPCPVAISGSVHPVFVTHVHTGSAAKHTTEVTIAAETLTFDFAPACLSAARLGRRV